MGQDAAQLRSTALRILVAVLVAGGLTTLVILVAWGPLDVRTDVIGYPVFKDFNVYNYFNAYYLIVGLFPLAALLLFLGLTRLAPRLGLAAPLKRGPLRPAFRPAEDRPRLAGEQPLIGEPEELAGAARVVRRHRRGKQLRIDAELRDHSHTFGEATAALDGRRLLVAGDAIVRRAEHIARHG